MKLTWFAGTTVRLHIGGEILVVDADHAPDFVDRTELVSGADRVFALAGDAANLPLLDPVGWRPRAAPRAVDVAAAPPALLLHRLAEGTVLVDTPGEPPCVLVSGSRQPPFGRWLDGTVVVLLGTSAAAAGLAMLEAGRPRLVALGLDDTALESVIAKLRPHLDGAALVALEPALALEI